MSKFNPKYKSFLINELKESEEKLSTVLLDSIGRDLTKLASDNEFDPTVGRVKEMDEVISILARRRKNNPVLIGDPGVGKTAIVEGIAQLIKSGDCPDVLKGKRIIELDMATIMSNTPSQGDLEKKVKRIINELKDNEDVILFIDEIHMIVDSNKSIDVSNMFKPALARGDMRCIGATTDREYKIIEKDGALERRFQKVNVSEPSQGETIEILNRLRKNYGEFHGVVYSDDAVVACVKLSGKYISDRFFPDKAIDLLDEVGARTRVKKTKSDEVKKLESELHKIGEDKVKALKSQKFEEASGLRNRESELQQSLSNLMKDENIITITKKDVEMVMSKKLDLPQLKSDDEDQSKKYLELEKTLKIDIIGQDEAISKVSKCLRRNAAGLKDPNRPSGVFLFLGSTGTGKCHGKGTKILMYDGSIKNVEDVEVGDQLMGDDSTARNVISLANGKDNIYKIKYKSGYFTCNSNHILSLKKTGKYDIVNIPLNEYLEKNKTFKHTHKLWTTGVEFMDKSVSIDPYMVGLIEKDNCEKFIPNEYLYNSTEVRKRLLAGLIDSGGYMIDNCYLISTNNEKLADQIVFLSKSLGYMAIKSEKLVKKYPNKIYYNINISGDFDLNKYILIDRKKHKDRKQKKSVNLFSFDVEHVGYDNYYGFELDGNHLYLLGDFVVTHNTHTVKTLAKNIFNSESDMIRIDMSEYGEKHNVSRLIGSPPGYVGYGEGGQLTEKVRKKPYSILLLDELEKAHPDVLNVLLQVFEDGQLTDGQGKKVDFKNTIIIMTSNIGSRAAADVRVPVGFGTKTAIQEENAKEIIKKELKQRLAPEFLNRIDDIIIFAPLSKESIFKIIDVEINKLRNKLKDIGLELEITDSLRELLTEKGYDSNLGARPLRRAIVKYIEDPISEEILRKNLKDKVLVDYDEKSGKVLINGNQIVEKYKNIFSWKLFNL